MNNKGFTLTELLATLLVLSIIAGITIVTVSGNFGDAKEKTEHVFVDTIKDAMDIYLDSDGKNLNFEILCSGTLDKAHNASVKIYKASNSVTFNDVITSKYHPITQNELVNPANEESDCANGIDIPIDVYRDEDYVYYYSIDPDDFDCLENTSAINNLPELSEGFSCE